MAVAAERLAMRGAVLQDLGGPPRDGRFPEPLREEDEAIVHVHAAGLHPIVRALASGAHYGAAGALPAIPGVDGVGHLDDGSRVYFVTTRPPYGSMAERTVARRSLCIPLPDGVGDMLAAAAINPGLSGWLALRERARLVAG